ncbi:DUF1566 domain-containing protein [Flavobacterium sp.]|uniref:Lcl domain-containing protein n=1 Tax=Flavobacterium sp. TaxID=239 RepID=UPI003B9926C1
MKKLLTLIAFVITISTFAQAPQGFNYQATVRNNTGELIVNQNVLFKFNIMFNSQTSLPIYSETHQAPTDDLGQVNLVIGTGTATLGTFTSINWGAGNYFLGIELNTGSGYVSMGTTQLLSVPYALYANIAGSTIENNAGFTHYIGELFGGGIVVSVWKDAQGVERGLIASLTDLTDLNTGIPWTTPQFQNTAIGTTAESLRDGRGNTNAIVAQTGTGTSYAAGLCEAYNAGGFNDWYLPAIRELAQCYNNVQIVNEVLGDINGFQFLPYWSSSERSNSFETAALFQDFSSGEVGAHPKQVGLVVRAFRRF